MKLTSIILSLLFAFGSPAFGISHQNAMIPIATPDLQEVRVIGQFHEPVEFRLLPSSRLWIEGTTSVNSFECDAQSVTLDAKVVGAERVQGTVDVAVSQLECGRGRMNRDLQKAMHADEHPKITFRLESASQIAQADGEPIKLTAIGFLTVSGVERKVELPATALQSDDNSYRVSGSLPIRMTDYSINPPRALGGLIRVRDEIVVQFDLVIAASTTSIH